MLRDGTDEPVNPRDPELYFHQTTWPGARVPHAWIGAGDEKRSTLDLVGKGRFALLTGIPGAPWVEAARQAAAALGIELATYVIGPGQEHTDLYDDWARLREVEEDGCALVRPDAHVCWRSMAMPADPAGDLEAALRTVLDRAADGVGASDRDLATTTTS